MNFLYTRFMSTPTIEQLRHALRIAEQIAKLEHELSVTLGNHSASAAKPALAWVQHMQKRSPATIARMRAGQQARWAKVKAPAVSKAPAKAPVKKKSTMSAQGLANIKAAQKKRWAKIKADAKKAPATPKAEPKKAPAPVKKRPTMSAEAKAKLSAMMKARWEAKKAATAPAASEAPAATETATE
jgi:hypothetical protein